jgi:hypothetical protein
MRQFAIRESLRLQRHSNCLPRGVCRGEARDPRTRLALASNLKSGGRPHAWWQNQGGAGTHLTLPAICEKRCGEN